MNSDQRRYRTKVDKSSPCAACGFVGEPCQKDVDHIDGNHANNAASNLQILCANCHRLKTMRNRDHLPSLVSQ